MSVSHAKLVAAKPAAGSGMLGPIMVLVLALGAMLFALSFQKSILLGQIAAVVMTPLAIFGLFRGGIRKTGTLLAVVGALYLVAVLPPALMPIVAGTAGTSASAVSYLVTGVAVIAGFVAVSLASKALRRKVERWSILSAVDRMAGGLVGAAEGGLAVLALCWVCTSVEPHAARLRDQGPVAIGSVQYDIATGMVRLGREASLEPWGSYLRDSNPINKIPALQKAVDSLNQTGQMQIEGLDPQIMEQIRNLLKSGRSEESLESNGTFNSAKQSQAVRNSTYQNLPQPGK